MTTLLDAIADLWHDLLLLGRVVLAVWATWLLALLAYVAAVVVS